MNKLRQYSPFFDTIADEDPSHSLLKIGRGHHFSVLQLKNREHRFLVIWDEDHDTRIIDVIEQMLLEPDRFPFKFRDVIAFGERKAIMSVVINNYRSGHSETSVDVRKDHWGLHIEDRQYLHKEDLVMCEGPGMPEAIESLARTFGIVTKDPILDLLER